MSTTTRRLSDRSATPTRARCGRCHGTGIVVTYQGRILPGRTSDGKQLRSAHTVPMRSFCDCRKEQR